MNRGSEWRIWDLHFHTPASYDYKNKSVTNEEIVNGLVSNGVSVVAVTDHDIIDVQMITELRNLGMPKGLHVLPGIEFCSELGGSESVHFIGIFPDNADLESIWTKIQGQCNLTKADIEKRGGYERVCCEFVKTCNLIESIGDFAFYWCNSLASVIIPNSVTRIGYAAFARCSALSTVTLGNSVEWIGAYAFADCESLSSFTIHATDVPDTTNDIFDNSSVSDATLYVPVKLLNIYNAIYWWNSFGTILPIDDSTKINEYDVNTHESTWYDLSGRITNYGGKGVMIKNGKKYVRR